MADIREVNTQDSDSSPKPMMVWSNITNADTPTKGEWLGGSGNIEVTGTFGGATLTVQFNKDKTGIPYDIKENGTATGVFSEPNILPITGLSAGYINLAIVDGDGTQDITVKIIRDKDN